MIGKRGLVAPSWTAWLVLLAAMLITGAGTPEPQAPGSPAPSVTAAAQFAWVDLYVDTGDAVLAAYQLELTAARGRFRIVGVEGGEHAAFREAPYYDPAALQHDRVIIAAFSLADALPAGRIRVARVHVLIDGERPAYAAALTVAAGPDGRALEAQVSTEEGAAP